MARIRIEIYGFLHEESNGSWDTSRITKIKNALGWKLVAGIWTKSEESIPCIDEVGITQISSKGESPGYVRIFATKENLDLHGADLLKRLHPLWGEKIEVVELRTL